MHRSKVPAILLGMTAALTFPVLAGVGEDDHGHAPSGAPSPSASHGRKPHHNDPAHDPHKGESVSMSARPSGKGADKPAEKPSGRAANSKAQAKKDMPSDSGETPDAETALKWLSEGNARWVANQEKNPNTESSRRAKLADEGQRPFVTVLTCADSRIPVERVFDRGVGDVFTVRVAGNVAGGSETGTIEYGVGHLQTPLLVVMGHTKCGAVAAAATGAEVHGKVAELVGAIKPAVERAKRNNPELDGAELVPAAIRENVWQSVFDLFKNSTEVRTQVSEKKLRVVGAVYDIATGKVEFLGEHPWEGELIEAMNARAAARQAASADEGGMSGH